MTSLFSCLCSGGFEKDRSIRRDWGFPHSPPLDPDLSDVEEDDEYYTYPKKGVTKTVASTAKVFYDHDDDDDDGGGDNGYSSDGGIDYGSGENSMPTGGYNDGGYEYDDDGYDRGSDDGYDRDSDDGYASSDGGGEGDEDAGSSYGGGD
ncbi:hypothetical protein HAX54_048108 [Datura stramonium]|uniref:Uncharacterized protein n=1 Tax=Datura stramonium TaxID=4076 RepID=A0ABS8RQL0_DATST|nr:hypothetical protein [Datura stramonium]